MLTPDQVLPFLQHEDRAVRDHAVRYLVSSMDCGAATADDLWRSIDRFGMQHSATCLGHLCHLPQTPYSYTRLVDALNRVTDARERKDLEAAFITLSPEILNQNRDEILAFKAVPEFLRNHHARRLKLDTMSFDDLWQRLSSVTESFFEDADDSDDEDEDGIEDDNEQAEGDSSEPLDVPGGDDGGDADGDDDLEGERLVETMLRRFPQAACARAWESIRATGRARPGAWMLEHCINILGRAKDRAAAPFLLERMRSADDEMLTHSITLALARLGDADLVSRLEAIYHDEADSVEWQTIIGMLAGINIPETEPTLLRLFRSEGDFNLRTQLAGSLVKLCAGPEAMQEVQGVLVESRDRIYWNSLAERFLAAATMVGFDSPILGRWRRHLSDLNARFNAESAAMERFSLAKASASETPSVIDAPRPDIQPTGTIHRSAPKIGRNDACPCGSGKKYKKCCMKAEE